MEILVGVDRKDQRRFEKAAKQKGLWALEAKTRIGTSGTALDVKLPQKLVRFLGLKKGTDAMIKPIDRHRFEVEV